MYGNIILMRKCSFQIDFSYAVEHSDVAVVVIVVIDIGGGDRFDVSFRFAYNFSVCAHTIFAFLVIDSAVELHGTSGQVD